MIKSFKGLVISYRHKCESTELRQTGVLSYGWLDHVSPRRIPAAHSLNEERSWANLEGVTLIKDSNAKCV